MVTDTAVSIGSTLDMIYRIKSYPNLNQLGRLQLMGGQVLQQHFSFFSTIRGRDVLSLLSERCGGRWGVGVCPTLYRKGTSYH